MSYLKVLKSDTSAINAHYERCKNDQIPYVLCKVRRTKADVEFDFITLSHELEAAIDARADEVRSQAIAIFKQYPCTGASYDVSSKVMFFRDLDVASAEAVARDLYLYICDIVGVVR